MSQAPTPKSIKWTIRLLSVLLFTLFAWLLSFVISDLGNVKGPSRADFGMRHVESGLNNQIAELEADAKKQKYAVERQQEIQANLLASMEVARQTMEQMAELHRLSLERDISPSEEQSKALSDAQTRYIDSQAKFEVANQQIATLNTELHGLQNTLASTRKKLQQQQQPGFNEWQEAWNKYELKTAAYKLSFIIPIFLLAAFTFAKRKKSIYRGIYLAMLMAAFWHLGRVMHDYFPDELFKYLAIAAGIFIVLFFLMRVLKSAAKPQADALLKRRKESYINRCCPECSFPYDDFEGDNCPSCGIGIFEKCNSCGERNHNLLPFCSHCGHKS